MSKSKIATITIVVIAITVFFAWLRTVIYTVPGLNKINPAVMTGIMMMIGVIGSAILTWVMLQKSSKEPPSGAAAAAAEAEAEATDVDSLLEEAVARLAESDVEKGAKLGSLPTVFLIGEGGSAKTTIMVRSGLEPDLLAGQVYEENSILPTPVGNLWFARRTVFAEAGGKLLSDASQWVKLVDKLQPGKLKSMFGAGSHAPRAAVVCVEAENLLVPGGEDALQTSARTLRARLIEVSQRLGINLPVYVLFSKADRIPFFMEYFANLNHEEATRVVGSMVPMVTSRQGVYAEEETARLGAIFERLFRSLCNARPEFLARERDPSQFPGVYEFPREFRKARVPLVRFLMELCKPSQLTTGPFLRGFYFSGVRPVVVNEVAPAAVRSEPQRSGGRLGATGMFRRGGEAQQTAAAPRIVGTRKVPQWMFLGHFFNDVVLDDRLAMGASAASSKANMPRRILLLAGAGLCILYSLALLISFNRNRGLESRVKQAAQGIASVEAPGANIASLDPLKRLETLRQSVATLSEYERDGAPWSYRWGLYVGSTLYPDARKVYFDDFKKLLLGQTQATLVGTMQSLPDTPGPEYGATYDTLKAYLITTSNHDKSTRAFLAPVLLNRWGANRNVDNERSQLAQKQFEFYSEELKYANPYSIENDAKAIEKARHYLAQFAGLERVYQAMLADAGRNNPPVNFNKRFPGSAEVLIDNQDVAGPFTKPGFAFMKASLKNPEKYFSGEQWVLGDQGAANIDRSTLGKQLADRYYSDYIKQWRAYMKAAAVVKYASLPDAAKKLNVLSGNQSPLLALFWLASQNTAVDDPNVATAFQPVQTVVPPASVDRYIAPPNQSYMNGLVTLQTSVESIAAQPQGNDAGAQATLTNATNARVATKQIAQAFRPDSEAHLDAITQKLMEDPITNVEALLRNLGPQELNAKGKAMCTPIKAIQGKYPFSPNSSTQAAIADVNAVFKKPDGIVWKFYDENLQKLLPKQGSQYVPASTGGVNLNPAFVAWFNQAASVSDFLYAGGSADPHITYLLKPAPAEGIKTVVLQLDGQAMTYSIDVPTPKQFMWQASGVHEAKASVKLGDTPLGWSNHEGLWSVFQFFGEAEKWTQVGNNSILEWVVRVGKDPALVNGKPLTVRFELDMGGGPPVFKSGYLSRLGCVAEVAK